MPENVEMSQETAQVLFQEGATLIFLNVPKGTEFGIDMKSWNTGENFKGVKMIPPGLHFIHYSAVGKMGDTAPRIGFLHNFIPKELLVMKWDSKLEDINQSSVSSEEVERIRQNLKNLDKSLGPYPYDVYDKWKNLTSHITLELVEKLQPASGNIRSALELVSCSNADRPRGVATDKNEASTSKEIPAMPETLSPGSRRKIFRPGMENIDDDLLPDLKPVPGTEIRFTQFPERSYPDGSTPAEITKHSLDSSYVLEYLIKAHQSPIDLIGELQFAFICFLIGHSLDAFEHWKRIANIICSSESALSKFRIVFDSFLTAFDAELVEVPEDFLANIVSNNNFVYHKLRELFRSIDNSNIDGRLKTKARRFKMKLTQEYQWDFSNLNEDEDDEAPVIVEIEEST